MKNKGRRWLRAFPIGASASAVLFFIIASFFAEETRPQTGDPAPASPPHLKQALVLLKAQALVIPDRPHLVYRHSVIPGGVHRSSELTSALGRDRFASVHYAKFDAANAYIVHVKAPRAVYVSYRMDDEIYWTKKRVQLFAGEALLTDGKSFVRTRCGNRIADTPQPLVSDREPPPEVLDAVIAPPRAARKHTTKSPNNEGALPAPFNGLYDRPDNSAPPVETPFPGVFPPPSSAFPTPPRIPVPEDSTTAVPEPASFALAMLALIILIVSRARIARKRETKWRR